MTGGQVVTSQFVRVKPQIFCSRADVDGGLRVLSRALRTMEEMQLRIWQDQRVR